jgi:hypothetical protein
VSRITCRVLSLHRELASISIHMKSTVSAPRADEHLDSHPERYLASRSDEHLGSHAEHCLCTEI